MPVYRECRQRGESIKSKCAPMDYICQCDALKAIQLCFLQCTDDINISNEGKAYEPAVAQICSLGTSQSLTRYPMPTTTVSLATTSSTPPTNIKNSGGSVERCWNELLIVGGVIAFWLFNEQALKLLVAA
ncbi:16982_t:CDS:2 [Dentiscutata heterogama]|uniref:16982_t:CDS:1 n=1 Tax=Dentiscutata heterogama TaxID=1316150 RepID=A0ACA9L9J8_9GLOM|nr:16982_t:CDS:2 [Dentiscutata heterogama]